MTRQSSQLRVRGVIFDMDGTLADSIQYYYRIACEVAELAEAPCPSRERVCELMGSGDPDLLRKLLPADYPDVEATLSRIRRTRGPMWRRGIESIEPIPGCVAMVHGLRARGVRLGIATSSGRALPYLERWGVRPCFDEIVGREDVERRKPHPESVLRCLEKLDLDPADAAYVGDSRIDIEAGRAAGVHTVGVLTGTSTRSELESTAAAYILKTAVGLLDLLPG